MMSTKSFFLFAAVLKLDCDSVHACWLMRARRCCTTSLVNLQTSSFTQHSYIICATLLHKSEKATPVHVLYLCTTLKAFLNCFPCCVFQ